MVEAYLTANAYIHVLYTELYYRCNILRYKWMIYCGTVILSLRACWARTKHHKTIVLDCNIKKRIHRAQFYFKGICRIVLRKCILEKNCKGIHFRRNDGMSEIFNIVLLSNYFNTILYERIVKNIKHYKNYIQFVENINNINKMSIFNISVIVNNLS